MREILFRGKRTYNGEWVEGFYLNRSSDKEDIHCIMEKYPVTTSKRVFPETVGQYTGLTDKNGTKVFEGDILKFSYSKNDEKPTFYSVEWKNDRSCFGYAETADKMIEIDSLHCEVIGNIHDNPELLEVGGNA